jgi:hypothetical protein
MNPNETENALTLLTERMERIEKQNRWWMRTALVLGAALLMVVTLGAVQNQPGAQENVRTKNPLAVKPDVAPELIVTQDLVRTKNLQIVDDDGNVCADFAFVAGQPMLSLFDKDGNSRVKLGLFEGYTTGNPGLALFDEKGNVQLLLTSVEGDPELRLWDKSVHTRVCLQLFEGHPKFSMLDANGEVILLEP